MPWPGGAGLPDEFESVVVSKRAELGAVGFDDPSEASGAKDSIIASHWFSVGVDNTPGLVARASTSAICNVPFSQDHIEDALQLAHRAAAPVSGGAIAFEAGERRHAGGIETVFPIEAGYDGWSGSIEVGRGRGRHSDHA